MTEATATAAATAEATAAEDALTLNEYQRYAHLTASYPDAHRESYPMYGIAEEAGEVLGARKKFERGDYSRDVYEARLYKELGDLLWYVAEVATVHGWDVGDIASANLAKLADRAGRNVIKGDGDGR